MEVPDIDLIRRAVELTDKVDGHFRIVYEDGIWEISLNGVLIVGTDPNNAIRGIVDRSHLVLNPT
jgi:hypothetical protein